MANTAYLNSNQFSQKPLIGQVDLTVGPANVKSVLIDPDSVASNPWVAGQGVALKAGVGYQILVDQVADVQALAYGVIIFNVKKNLFVAGDTVEIACEGTVIYMEASAAISRGAFVSLDPSGPTVATQTTGARLGQALDQAAASGDLIRIELNFDLMSS